MLSSIIVRAITTVDSEELPPPPLHSFSCDGDRNANQSI